MAQNGQEEGLSKTADASAPAAVEKQTGLYKAAGWLTGWLVYGLFRLKVIRGKDNIAPEGGFIVAGNHIHLADPVFLRFAQKRQIHYMAKAELFDKPLTRWLCSSYGAFPVVRGKADDSALNTALDILNSGKLMGTFPEGTRSKDGSIGRGKSGTVYLAYHSGKPIYPFAVYCKRKPIVPFCGYTIAFGDPVTAADLGVVEGTGKEFREATRKLMAIITDLHEQCKAARE